jgi:hypothetical protein
LYGNDGRIPGLDASTLISLGLEGAEKSTPSAGMVGSIGIAIPDEPATSPGIGFVQLGSIGIAIPDEPATPPGTGIAGIAADMPALGKEGIAIDELPAAMAT